MHRVSGGANERERSERAREKNLAAMATAVGAALGLACSTENLTGPVPIGSAARLGLGGSDPRPFGGWGNRVGIGAWAAAAVPNSSSGWRPIGSTMSTPAGRLHVCMAAATAAAMAVFFLRLLLRPAPNARIREGRRVNDRMTTFLTRIATLAPDQFGSGPPQKIDLSHTPNANTNTYPDTGGGRRPVFWTEQRPRGRPARAACLPACLLLRPTRIDCNARRPASPRRVALAVPVFVTHHRARAGSTHHHHHHGDGRWGCPPA